MDRSLIVDRRSFIASSAAVGGALVLGFHVPTRSAAAAAEAPEINAWIKILPDDTVIVRVARAEMGQGILTALPMLVAEELECDWAKVRPELVSPRENLARHRVWGDMTTSASRSINRSQETLRQAGATARQMLIAAAAARWHVPAAECRAASGVITHTPSGRTVRFGEVAQSAALVALPDRVALKDPKDWTLIGTPQKRFDVPDKVAGKPIYAGDVRLPGMLYAAIIQCPVFKGTLRSVDQTKVASMKGARRVVAHPDMVAVVADSWWQAKLAADILPVVWDNGEYGRTSNEAIENAFRQGLGTPDASVVRNDGDIAAGLAGAARFIEADYAVPFLAHATMEPQVCTARVTADRVEIWTPTQDAETALAIAADAAGVPRQNVVVHRMMLGGGFGRRGAFQDYVRQAVVIAKEVGRPVQLIWSREQDIRHDFYRPMTVARQTAGLDAAGWPVAWQVRIAGQSIVASLGADIPGLGFDRNMAQGFLEDMPYDVPNYFVVGTSLTTPVPVGPWRATDYSQNVFFRESFVDEMAHAAGQDPYHFRRRLLAENPKHLAVLDAAAERFDWRAPRPPRTGYGIAIGELYGSICAQVVEVSVSERGALRVHRVVSAIDPGHAVNPPTIEMQTEGAVAYGLTAALYGEITIRDGRVEQSNFHDYRILRMSEMPQVETVIVPSGGFWGGAGEPPLPPLAPALCNAIFAATGKRIRSLPLQNQDLSSGSAAGPGR